MAQHGNQIKFSLIIFHFYDKVIRYISLNRSTGTTDKRKLNTKSNKDVMNFILSRFAVNNRVDAFH
jgi:hypothetical protein